MKHSKILLVLLIAIFLLTFIYKYFNSSNNLFSAVIVSNGHGKFNQIITKSDLNHRVDPLNNTGLVTKNDNGIYDIKEVTANKSHNTRKNKSLIKLLNFNGYVPIFGQKKLDLQCHTCSLVSSSGHLLHSNAGKEIDSSDCVIRMNDAPVVNFEEDVGTKTTLRFVAHSSISQLARQKNLLHGPSAPKYVLVWGPEVHMRTDGKGRAYNIAKKAASENKNINFFILSPSQMNHADNVFLNETGENRQKSGVWLSTGFFTMIYVINICNITNVYGMVDKDYCHNHQKENIPYHYYSTKLKECSYYNGFERMKHSKHLFALEKGLFGLWSQEYSIFFKYPRWDYND